METQLPPDFRDFLKLLNSEGVEYLVVGGYAVSFHGYPRPTGDLDIWIAIAIENAKKVRTVLEHFGFAQDRRAPEEFLTPNQIFRMGVPPVRIEVLTGATGVDFATCYPRRVEAELDGVVVKFLSRDDLIANKRAAGRHKDLNDVERLTGG
jgi:predicted nucleotidyltransferase